MVLSPLSLLVVETETVVPAVRHQNVPHIINDNSGRVVELAVSSSGRSKFSEGLQVVGVENVDLIKPQICNVQLALGECQEPALGLPRSVPNQLLQGDPLHRLFLLQVVTPQMCFLRSPVEVNEPETPLFILSQTETLPRLVTSPNSGHKEPFIIEHLDPSHVLNNKRG